MQITQKKMATEEAGHRLCSMTLACSVAWEVMFLVFCRFHCGGVAVSSVYLAHCSNTCARISLPFPISFSACWPYCLSVSHDFSCCALDIQSNLGSRMPRIMNSLFYEQIFRTLIISDDILCLELRTRKLSKRRKKQITLDNFLVRQRPSWSEAESSGAKRQKKEKESPSKQ